MRGRYWSYTLIGLAIAGAALVAVDWGLYHLVRTGTCSSGGPYVSARPCPPGTGLHILALIGGIFAGLAGVGLYTARGGGGRPSPIGLGLVMWCLLFTTIAGAVALAAFGPANDDNSGARITAVVLGAIFVPMGLAPLAFVLGGRRRANPSAVAFVPLPRVPSTPPPTPPARPAARPATGDEDAIAKIERLAALRDKGLINQAEFEAQKRRLLGEV